MKRILFFLLSMVLCFNLSAQTRRPIDNEHPMWLIHVDVWNQADPQKIIDLIPKQIRPYVVMNLSLSCSYDTDLNIYMRGQNAIKCYKSWGTICQQNGMWFCCQPASGGHTHIMDDDLETFEYMFKNFPNFLGWNYAEQFWGFNEPNDKSSTSDVTRIALFAKLVEMSHKYGGFLTVSFCGNIWSHHLNPVGMMKRNKDLQEACQKYPEAILWLYKYTTSSCFYNNESVTWSPFVSGYAANYGVRYDNCGWNGAMDAILGENHGKKYPVSAGFGTVMEQTCVNGGAVWDGPELIWTEDFQNLNNSTDANGFTVRNWGVYPGFQHGWLDMFDKIIDGTMYIPTREEVVQKTKIYVVNDMTSGSDEDKYAAWGDLYDGLYKQVDGFNVGNGQWMSNYCYFKSTGRYGAVPVGLAPCDSLAKAIPTQVKKSVRSYAWGSQSAKVNSFNKAYEQVSTGDLYVNRFKNQLVTYTPYTYLNKHRSASARIPLLYNTCDSLILSYSKLSTGIVHEYADHISLYLNNYRSDSTSNKTDTIVIKGVPTKPLYSSKKRTTASTGATIRPTFDAEKQTYTVLVSHNGPIDLDIYCSGTATDRRTDVVNSTALETPKQPEPYFGPIVVEAEDMNYKSVANSINNYYYTNYRSSRGHAGNGFVDMGTSTNGTLQATVKLRADQAGDYRVIVRYCNVKADNTINIVKGATATPAKVIKTAQNNWLRTEAVFSFAEGNNSVYIRNNNGVGIYIDNVTFMPVNLSDEKYAIIVRNLTHGKVELSADSAAEGETVQIRVLADQGYRFKGWTVLRGGVSLASTDETSFTMPDDNVILQPEFEDMTMVYRLDYSSVLAGTLPAGWIATQGDNETHEYPNSYPSGARVLSGFTGYQGKALYWRVVSLEYGRQNNFPLNLEPGHYVWNFAMAAWKGTPKYKAQVLDANGKQVAGLASLSATPNADGNTSANVAMANSIALEFDVTTAGKYYLKFSNIGGGFDEFLLLKCEIKLKPTEDGIFEISVADDSNSTELYSLDGRRIESLQNGVNIIRTKNGVKKMIVR